MDAQTWRRLETTLTQLSVDSDVLAAHLRHIGATLSGDAVLALSTLAACVARSLRQDNDFEASLGDWVNSPAALRLQPQLNPDLEHENGLSPRG